jgi:molybdopterin synthase sulfur carrier subunit
MPITVKFIGALRHVSGKSELSLCLNCQKGASLRELINEITREKPELKRSLIDQQLEDPRANALILVNGMEISVLNGLETNLKNGDEIVFIPVVHGG